MQNDVEGSLRLMTPGEIAMAKRVFGHSIVYSRVWRHCDSYLPFGLQSTRFAMTPNGELWFRKEKYAADYSDVSVTPGSKHLFIHEMGHVWQHQTGRWVRLRGSFSWAADYTYRLDKEKITDYTLEQQAAIIADYWFLLTYGMKAWLDNQGPNRLGNYRGVDLLKDVPMLYRKIIYGCG
ncbi:type IV secretion protein Rhs [Cronobacter dublinensis]